MNNTTLGNTSWLPPSDTFLKIYAPVTAHCFSLVVRLPINIFVVQVILSRRWISSETYVFREAVIQIFISIYDTFSIASYFYPDKYLLHTSVALEVILVIGHPSLLAVISVERYLAVVKPLLYLRLKPMQCGLPLGGLICMFTLVMFTVSLFRKVVLVLTVVVHNGACCGLQLYCFAAMVWALKQPGPGDTGGKDVRMSMMKLRALKLILWSIVRILLVYVPLTIICTVDFSIHSFVRRLAIVSEICYASGCLVDFVLAMMFLHRSGKVTFIQCL